MFKSISTPHFIVNKLLTPIFSPKVLFMNQKSFLIQSQNNETFSLTIEILPISKILSKFLSKKKIDTINHNVKEYLVIEAKSFNDINSKNNFFEVYSLCELKSFCENFYWFNDLYDFLNAFSKGINNKEYELIINVKNFCILNINIENIFGNKCLVHILLRENENRNINNINFNNSKKNNYLITRKEQTKITQYFKEDREEKFLTRKRKSSNEKQTNEKFHKINIPQIFSYYSLNSSESITKFSSIIQSSNDISLIERKLISQSNFYKKSKTNIFYYKLLFKSSKDGDLAKDFHKKCDSFNKILILIKTKNGIKFGGYTASKFGGEKHYKYDNKAFLFCLGEDKIFSIEQGKYALYSSPSLGPCFAHKSLYIPNQFLKNTSKVGKINSSFKFKFNYELNKGNEKFIVDELEIYKILLI